ncbi:MAG: HEAT repeat domain-containing protein, partial [Vicinamibacteria bacterium]|nr:HEAT repeat domain-containing protein [Vicinamibacteria bacterium]
VGLRAGLAQADGWVGWDAPSKPTRAMCCWDSFEARETGQGGSCRLDRTSGMNISGDRDVASLTGPQMRVFARLERGRPRDVRVYSAGCRVDAGGAAVTWFDGVAPTDSVALLASWAGQAEQAIAAVALHEHPTAVEALLTLARDHGSAEARGQALFWISQQAGERAAAAIGHAIEHDPDQEVKEKAVFALSQLPKEQAVPLLLRTMQTNRNPEVRRQAAFWLGQSHDPRALAYFEELLR